MIGTCLPTCPPSCSQVTLEERVAPLAFLYLLHPHRPAAVAAHQLFCALLVALPEQRREPLAAYYMQRSLEGCPAGSAPPAELGQGLATVLASLPLGSPVALLCLQQVLEACSVLAARCGAGAGWNVVVCMRHLLGCGLVWGWLPGLAEQWFSEAPSPLLMQQRPSRWHPSGAGGAEPAAGGGLAAGRRDGGMPGDAWRRDAGRCGAAARAAGGPGAQRRLRAQARLGGLAAAGCGVTVAPAWHPTVVCGGAAAADGGGGSRDGAEMYPGLLITRRAHPQFQCC